MTGRVQSTRTRDSDMKAHRRSARSARVRARPRAAPSSRSPARTCSARPRRSAAPRRPFRSTRSGTIVTIQTRAKTAGAYSIAVTTPVGEVSGGGFTFVAPPVISTVSTRSGSYKGGTKVTITGARLTSAQVTIGGKSAKQVSSGSTKLVVVAPAGTIGVHGAITVKTVGGSVSSGTFTWVR